MHFTRRQAILLSLIPVIPIFAAGCGNSDPEVYTAPGDPEPELTPEEEAGEEEYMKSEKQR